MKVTYSQWTHYLPQCHEDISFSLPETIKQNWSFGTEGLGQQADDGPSLETSKSVSVVSGGERT